MQAVNDLVCTLTAAREGIRKTLAESIFLGYNFGVARNLVDSTDHWSVNLKGTGLERIFWVDGAVCTFYVDFEMKGLNLTVRGYAKDSEGKAFGTETLFIDGEYQYSLDENRRTMAEDAFGNYDFGDDVEVVGTSGWESSTEDNEWSRSFFADTGKDDSEKLTFIVRFDPGTSTPLEVLARDRKGNDIGTPYLYQAAA